MKNKSFKCPDWLKTGLMYQIFPDRFAKSQSYTSPPQNKTYIMRNTWGGDPFNLPNERGQVLNNDFFGGNLAGIIEELPYLCELGVTVIYLNPIFEAYSNHRYDTADFYNIDPMLGTNEDFIKLCSESGKLGIRILLDGVFNHTGSDSIYFNKYGRYSSIGAYQSKDSPYYPWYQFIEYPDKYLSWWGIDTLPSIQEEDPSYLDFIIRSENSVVRHWLSLGASGFRLDVVDELPDIFLDEFRKTVKAVNEDAAIIGEVWEDASEKISYGVRRRYLQGDQLDSVMNYPLRDAVIRFLGSDGDAFRFSKTVERLWRNYPKTVFYGLMNILGTHDTPRILTVLSEGRSRDEGLDRFYAALVLWGFMPGIPCIYYGDEIGMKGGRDPLNRACFIKSKADRNILRQYRRLMAFRKKAFSLESGETMEFKPGYTEGSLYVFHRVGKSTRLLVAVNGDPGEKELPLDIAGDEKMTDYFISGRVSFKDLSTFRLEGFSGAAVLINRV